MKKFAGILECRMGSSRLPGKVLMDLAGTPLLKRIIERLNLSSYLETIILATTTNPLDDAIEDFALSHGIQYFRGSEDNVLERVLFCAEHYDIDNIVELHGDNPFLDANIIDRSITKFKELNLDYISNTLIPTFPSGLRVQVFPTKLLRDIYEKIDDPHVNEHVSLYFYENPDLYNISNLEALPEEIAPELRLTVDTPEDFQLASKVYSYFDSEKLTPNFSIPELISFIRDNNLSTLNSHIQQKPARL